MMRKLISLALFLLIALVAAVAPGESRAAPPMIYSEGAHESPVRADPDDLLLLPGYGFSATDVVVYQAVSNTTLPLTHPASVPSSSTASLGLADVVSAADAPYTLTLHLPAVMTKDQSYALWVVDASGWSNGVLINDARPLWITPDFSYQSAAIANLPRVLKVVGQNLQPESGSTATQVRLIGPGGTYTLSAVADSTAATGATDPTSTPQIGRYVAKVKLPTGMTTGSYTVQVSRDGGSSWVPLLGENDNAVQSFTVLPDPATPTSYLVSDSRFGGCSPAIGSTPAVGNALICVLNAINAASAAGGGTVIFPAGVWTLDLPGLFSNIESGCEYPAPGATFPGGSGYPGVTCDGIVVPLNVNLQGAVSASAAIPATIERGPNWALSSNASLGNPLPTFNLQGNNTVSNLYFADLENYSQWDSSSYNGGFAPGSVLQLGFYFWHIPGGAGAGSGGYYNAPPAPASAISHVSITGNVFDKDFGAISNGGLPVDHLIVSKNIFGGTFNTAIYLAHNINNLWLPYTYKDSIIAFNTFYPSSFYRFTSAVYGSNQSVPANSTASVATQINTGLRADFSNNVADGTSTAYFYDQTITSANPKGWRAAYFWTTGRNQELTLVSQNQAYCTGDKAGDGEAIAYDNSSNLGGLLDVNGNPAAALNVIGAVPWTDANGNLGTALTVQGQLVDPINSVQTSSQAATTFYQGQWLQIVQGPGVGQWRKIVSLATTGSNASGKTVTFDVVPAFDVAPLGTQPNSGVVTIGPVYWQNATVDNNVDNSLARGCTQLNQDYLLQNSNVRPNPNAGIIAWDGPTADSAIDGNQQTSGGGIGLYAFFASAETNIPTPYVIGQSSNAVRNNIINGEYEWTSPYGFGGIYINTGASQAPSYSSTLNPTNPPILIFGATIAGNSITQAQEMNFNSYPSVVYPMGAIGVSPGINENGPVDSSGVQAWKITDATLIFHNSLSDVTGGGFSRAGIGISALVPPQSGQLAPTPEVWRSVLYANTCSTVQTSVLDYGMGTSRYCPAGASSTCECNGTNSVDVGVSVTAGQPAVLVGGTISYVATVTNNSASTSATGVALSLEPSAGVKVSSMVVSSGPSGSSCDASVNVCSLGVLTHGRSATITVTETALATGNWSNAFSVSHQDPDPITANNEATVTTVVGPLSMNLASVFNVYGIFSDGSAVTHGGLDNSGTAASENLLGSSVAWSGLNFVLGQVGVPSVVSNTTISLPSGQFSSLNFLGSAVNGNHTGQTFIVTYMDGTTTSYQQSLSDWRTPQAYSGESTATTMAYKLTITGATHAGPYYFYGYTLALNSAKTVKSIALPPSRDVVVLAISLVPAH